HDRARVRPSIRGAPAHGDHLHFAVQVRRRPGLPRLLQPRERPGRRGVGATDCQPSSGARRVGPRAPGVVHPGDEPDAEARGGGAPRLSGDRRSHARPAEDHAAGADPGRRAQRAQHAGSRAEPRRALAARDPGGSAGRERLRPALGPGPLRCDLARVCAILARVRADCPGGTAMGDILGIGTTHYPPGLVPEEHKPWPLARMLHSDPRIPAHMKDPANWPAPMRAEWADDEGIASFRAHRARVFSAFRTLRDEIDAFRPDFILMWGDDQDENFGADIIPPFCVLAYDKLEFQPFKRLGKRPNIWGEPGDKTFTWPGQPAAGRHLATRLLEPRIHMPDSSRPLPGDGVAHAVANALLYLDLDRKGFPSPMLPVAVNCYGRDVVRNQ